MNVCFNIHDVFIFIKSSQNITDKSQCTLLIMIHAPFDYWQWGWSHYSWWPCCDLSSHVCCVAADLFSSSYKSLLTISPGMSGMRPVWLEASYCSLIGCCHLIDALIGQKRNNWLCCSNHIKILNCCGFCGLLFILTCLMLKQWKGKRDESR